MSRFGKGAPIVLAVFVTAACASQISNVGRSARMQSRAGEERPAAKPHEIQPSDAGHPSAATMPGGRATPCEEKTLSFRRKGDPKPNTQTDGVEAPPVFNDDVAYRLECRGGVPILRVHRGDGYVMTRQPDPYWDDVTLSTAEWMDLWNRIDSLTLLNCAGPGEVHREVRIVGTTTRAATCDATDAPALDALEDLFSKIEENRKEEGLRRLLDYCKNGCWEGELR